MANDNKSIAHAKWKEIEVMIAEYIKHQLDEGRLGEHMTMFGKDDDPFKGSK